MPASLPAGEYEVKLGDSFSNSTPNRLHTLRYDFLPASADTTVSGSLSVDASNKAAVEHAGGEGVCFNGKYEACKPEECILMVERDANGAVSLRLERLQSCVKNLRHIRTSGKPKTAPRVKGASAKTAKQSKSKPTPTHGHSPDTSRRHASPARASPARRQVSPAASGSPPRPAMPTMPTMPAHQTVAMSSLSRPVHTTSPSSTPARDTPSPLRSVSPAAAAAVPIKSRVPPASLTAATAAPEKRKRSHESTLPTKAAKHAKTAGGEDSSSSGESESESDSDSDAGHVPVWRKPTRAPSAITAVTSTLVPTVTVPEIVPSSDEDSD